MRGFVPTPEATVDAMIGRLFRNCHPRKDSRLLDPGCGYGAFIEGVLRWCHRHNIACPEIIGVELDPEKFSVAKKKLLDQPRVSLLLVLPWIHRVFANLKRWALGVYHGLRRPHLQAYLDEFAFRFNRRHARHAAFRTLLGLGLASKPVTYKMLIAPELKG